MIADLAKNHVVPAVFGRLPKSLLVRLAGVNPAVAYYHIVSDEQVAHVRHLYRFRTVAEFKDDLDTFARMYRPISLEQLIEAVRAGNTLPKNALLVTFDDGFREVYDVAAPVLEAKGIPAVFFLATAFLDNQDLAHHNKISVLIERLEELGAKGPNGEISQRLDRAGIKGPNLSARLLSLEYRQRELVDELAVLVDCNFSEYLSRNRPYLTSGQVRELLRRGFAIGAHSVDHPLYSALPLEEQIAQTVESVQFLRRRFSLDYSAFAFPHGDRGVSKEFFERIFGQGRLDVSFGSAGLVREASPRHFQRFTVEYMARRAEYSVSRAYARSICKRMLGGHVVKRTGLAVTERRG
jgi:peptidoglycan/xylan/chitin deacetylase (PgdA/CDA1 family)